MPATKFRILKFLFWLLSCATAQSQVPTDAFEFTGGAGHVVRNHPDFPDIDEPSYNISLNYSRQYNGYRPWHRYYNYPRMAISLNSGAMGNNAVLGHYAGLMAEMSFEKGVGKSWFWAPRLSFGASWFSDPFHEEQNPENVVIGSEFAFLVAAEVAGGRRISDQVDAVVKVGILHASNSHFKLPNVGMNMPLVSAGIRYKWPASEKESGKYLRQDTLRLNTSKRIRLHARLALGVNEFGSSTTPVNGPKYPIYLCSVFVSKMFSPVNKVTAGVEAWYNKGVYNFIVSQEFYDEQRHKRSCAAAVVIGHEFLMGRFGLITTGGIYFYNPFYKERLKRNEIDGVKDKLKSYIPARLGIQYYLKNTNFKDKNNLFAGVYIKTNFGQADFLESGFGYMF